MNKVSLFIGLFTLCIFSYSCEKATITIGEEELVVPLFVNGEVTGNSIETYTFEYQNEINEVEGIFYVFHDNIFQGELGPTLIASVGYWGNFPFRTNTADLLDLQFWGDQGMPADRKWTQAETNDFFRPGRAFNFGSGVNTVQLSLRIPSDQPRDLMSGSALLDNPTGQVTILTTEPYTYLNDDVYADMTEVFGTLVHCRFSGEIGIYSLQRDLMDSQLGNLITDEIAELNGEMTFFIESGRQ